MELIKSILILVIGFVLLLKGADYFVEGSSSVAKQLRIPSMIIGMTIVAMGTSLPECAVSVTASLAGNNTLAVSNVVGSNIFNLMVVCGACALFAPLTIKKDTLKKEFPLSIICASLLMVLGYIGMILGHIDGVVFLILFAGYLLWMINSAKKARAAHKEDELMKEEGEFVDEEIKLIPMWKCAIYHRWNDRNQIRRRFCCRQCFFHCAGIRTQPDTDRTYDRGTWNQSSGADDIHRCGKEE